MAIDGLTVDRLNEQGTQLIFRMKSFVRPRCQPLFFDMRLNTVENALLNFYQAMLLGAVKTVGYVCIGMSGGAKHNPQHADRVVCARVAAESTVLVLV